MFTTPAKHLLAEMGRLDLMLLRFLNGLEDRGDTGQRILTEADVRPLLEMDGEAPPEGQTDGDLEEWLRVQGEAIRRNLHTSLRAGMRLPLVEVCRNLGLDAESVGILLLGIAPHIHPKYETIFAYLQGQAGAVLPRVEFALRLFSSSEEGRLQLRHRFAAGSPLLASGFVELDGPDTPRGRSQLPRSILVDPRLVRFLLGEEGATPVVEACRLTGDKLPPPTQAVEDALTSFERVWRSGERPGAIAVVATEDPQAVLGAVAALGERRGGETLLVDLATPRARAFALEARIRGIFAEARLTGALLALTGFDGLSEAERAQAKALCESVLEGFDGAVVFISREGWALREALRQRPLIHLSVEDPGLKERRQLWREALGEGADPTVVDHLGRAFRLSSEQIRDAARIARFNAQAAGERDAPPALPYLQEACQGQSGAGLGKLAQPLPTRGGWGRLVLPERSVGQLRELLRYHAYRDQVMEDWGFGEKVMSAKGIVALFAGSPGTGKTLAASLIAGELGLRLYRIDLAEIVSKYIGETEKNLDRVFQAAERSNAVLFFDEADALFGKRTEVKDAHDRYANIETSYLLQKLEVFDGLTLLATNFKRNLDDAFVRRIHLMIHFPDPEPAERRRLWETLIPDAMPLEPGVDLDFLAERFELSGGHIKNAIQGAALLAAERGEAVSFGGLLLGVYRELQKLGRLPGRREFRPHYARLEEALKVAESAPPTPRPQG